MKKNTLIASLAAITLIATTQSTFAQDDGEVDGPEVDELEPEVLEEEVENPELTEPEVLETPELLQLEAFDKLELGQLQYVATSDHLTATFSIDVTHNDNPVLLFDETYQDETFPFTNDDLAVIYEGVSNELTSFLTGEIYHEDTHSTTLDNGVDIHISLAIIDDEAQTVTDTPMWTLEHPPVIQIGNTTTDVVERVLAPEYQPNPELAFEETAVLESQPGEPAGTVTTTTYTLDDETNLLTDPTEETIETEGTPEIIEVGNVLIEETTQAFETEMLADETLPFLDTVERLTGVEGLTRTTTTYALNEDGTINYESGEVEEVVLEEPITRQVAYGPIDVTTEASPFGTEYRGSETLEFEATQVVQEGVEGETTITRTVAMDTNLEITSDETEREVVSEPVTQIIEVGNIETRTDVTEFETTYEVDESLDLGEEVVEVEGVNGEVVYEIVYEVEADGTLTNPTETVISETDVVHKLVKVGENVETETNAVPFETIYEANGDLAFEDTQVAQEGVEGVETTTIQYEEVDGELVEASRSTEVTQAPVNEIIHVGHVEGGDTNIEHDVEYKEDANMKMGETRVQREGVNGSQGTTTTYTVNSETGELSDPEVVEGDTIEPTSEVVLVGTFFREHTEKRQITEIPFETIEVEDVTIPVGETKVQQPGVLGEGYMIITETLEGNVPFNAETGEIGTIEASENSKVVESKESQVTITQAPVDEVLLVGVAEETNPEETDENGSEDNETVETPDEPNDTDNQEETVTPTVPDRHDDSRKQLTRSEERLQRITDNVRNGTEVTTDTREEEDENLPATGQTNTLWWALLGGGGIIIVGTGLLILAGRKKK